MKENLFCKWFGHKFVKTIDNRLYYVKTCTRCGKLEKHYYKQEDANIVKRTKGRF